MASASDLDAWLTRELAKIRTTTPSSQPGFVLGVVVWGAGYIDRLARICLPTLMTPANAAGLRALNSRLLVYTRAEDFVRIWREVAPLEQLGIPVQFGYIPNELLDIPKAAIRAGDKKQHIYAALGTAQSLMVQQAGWSGSGFHMLMPDHCYSERFFGVVADMIEKRDGVAQGAIAMGAVSASIETAGAELDACRHADGSLRIGARQLGDLAWRHLHQQTKAVLLDGHALDTLPRSNVMLWRGKDALHLAGPFGNPVWMSPQLCRFAPIVAPTTLDAELPALMPGGFLLPRPEDDMVCVEFSDEEKGAPSTGGRTDFVQMNQMQMNFNEAYLPLMRARTLIPTEDCFDGLDEETIDRHQAALLELIQEGRVAAMERFMHYMLTANRQLRRSP